MQKKLNMKFIKNKLSIRLFALLLAAGLGFYACTEDKVVVPKTLEQYKSELSELVASEKAIVANCIVGYNKGDFRDAVLYPEAIANYMAVLLEAEAALANPDVTIADIVEANYNLSSPGKVFNDEVFKSDRRPLHERIVYCDTLRVHTAVGDSIGQAPQEAHTQFGAAISEAKGWRSRATTLDRQVTAAVDELDMELEIFEEAIVK